MSEESPKPEFSIKKSFVYQLPILFLGVLLIITSTSTALDDRGPRLLYIGVGAIVYFLVNFICSVAKRRYPSYYYKRKP